MCGSSNWERESSEINRTCRWCFMCLRAFPPADCSLDTLAAALRFDPSLKVDVVRLSHTLFYSQASLPHSFLFVFFVIPPVVEGRLCRPALKFMSLPLSCTADQKRPQHFFESFFFFSLHRSEAAALAECPVGLFSNSNQTTQMFARSPQWHLQIVIMKMNWILKQRPRFLFFCYFSQYVLVCIVYLLFYYALRSLSLNSPCLFN